MELEDFSPDIDTRLKDAIANDDAAKVHAVIAEKWQTLLVKNTSLAVRSPAKLYASPLFEALQQNKLQAARAVLEEMRIHRPQLLESLSQHAKNAADFKADGKNDLLYYLADNRLYDVRPHNVVRSEEGVVLLKEFGYRFEGAHMKTSMAECMLTRFAKRGATPADWEQERAWLKTVFSIEPVNAIRIQTISSAIRVTLAQFAVLRFAASLQTTGEAKPCPSKEECQNYLRLLAENGLDFRSAIKKPAVSGSFLWATPNVNTNILSDSLTAEVAAYSQSALLRFPAAATPALRRAAALASCAGGNFPALASSLARQSDEHGLTEATSYLDDYWRNEYRHSLRAAQATLARTAPVEESTLAHWIRTV